MTKVRKAPISLMSKRAQLDEELIHSLLAAKLELDADHPTVIEHQKSILELQKKFSLGKHENALLKYLFHYSFDTQAEQDSNDSSREAKDAQANQRNQERAKCADSASARSCLPARGMFVMALISPADVREALLGDVQEQFNTNRERFGLARAKSIFWRDFLGTLIALIARTCKKPVRWVVTYLGLDKIVN